MPMVPTGFLDDTSEDALILKLTIDATPPVLTTGDATGVAATKATLMVYLRMTGVLPLPRMCIMVRATEEQILQHGIMFSLLVISKEILRSIYSICCQAPSFITAIWHSTRQHSRVWSDQTKSFSTTASLVPVVGGSIGITSTDGTVFDVELKSDLVYIGTGTVSNGDPHPSPKILSPVWYFGSMRIRQELFPRIGTRSTTVIRVLPTRTWWPIGHSRKAKVLLQGMFQITGTMPSFLVILIHCRQCR